MEFSKIGTDCSLSDIIKWKNGPVPYLRLLFPSYKKKELPLNRIRTPLHVFVWLFSQTLLLFNKKYSEYARLFIKIGTFYEKRACKLILNIQNVYYFVKIGFRILTTIFTKTAFRL